MIEDRFNCLDISYTIGGGSNCVSRYNISYTIGGRSNCVSSYDISYMIGGSSNCVSSCGNCMTDYIEFENTYNE